MRKSFVAALATAAALTATAAGAQTVTNGSFESPTVTNSPNYYTTAPGVTFSGGGGGIEPNGGAFGYAAAPAGNQVAFLQNGGVVSLDVTGLTAGTDYFVNLLSAQRSGYAVLSLSVSFDGTTLGTFTPASTAFTAVSPFRFTAAGTTGSLTFAAVAGAGDLNAAIDNVTVAAVPEAATWAMMLVGFGMIGAGLRARRNAVVRFA